MSDDFYLHPLSLPPRASLEQYKKLARDFQHACKLADPGAIRQWAERSQKAVARLQGREITPQVHNGIDREARRIEQRWQEFQKSNEHATRCTLAGAQLFVARAHGFASWPKFAAHVKQLARDNSPVSNFEMAVDAIVSGDAASLKALLSQHPDLVQMRSTREHRSTLLHYVSANGVEGFRQKTPKNIVEIAKLLLDAGADVNAESEAYGGRSTTLGLTATSIHPQDAGVQIPLLELLIDRGSAIDPPDGGSAVVGCLKNGRGQAASYLASRGARLDLDGAAGIGRLDVVQSFFDDHGGLKPPATEQQAIDGFAWACEFGHIAVVDFLLRQGLKVDALSRGAETGLHWAALGAHREIVKLLLEHNAPVDVVDGRFQSKPLDWALHGWFTSSQPKPYPEVVALLVAAGAKPDPEWFDANPGRSQLAQKIRSDPRMLAALRGEMPP
jgi:ankyrin repeat protein